ncbi:TraR/DksA family transcriptional regulator [Streptomyces sp. NPDC059385]|uniref:TraR/DksA family transcriptional regulator n=1 Tax=Streptomyces sp. NPDC059385 TaxID=3346817 RepID=UPI0036BF8C89
MVAKKTAGSTAGSTARTAAATAAAGEEPARKASTKNSVDGKPPTGATEKAVAKKAAKKAVAVKKAVAAKAAPAGKAAAAGAENTTAVKATRKAPAKKAGAEGAAQAAKKTGVRKVVAKKSTGAARKTAAAATSGLPKARVTAVTEPGELAVRPGEDPWTPQEVAEARSELMTEVLRLRAELDASEVAISGLMRDSGDGAGDDQADTGTKNITRESELALAANATSMLEQTERALERMDAGTYGLCENCGKPIGKARMQAFPRATLCVDCKQKQERRH